VDDGLRVSRVEPAHAPALSALFDDTGFGCHCRFWHFQGTAREWLARCAHEPEVNREEAARAVAARSPDMRGFVAETPDGSAVGWIKVAPATVLGKLYEQRLYKGLPVFEGDRTGVFTIGCLLVKEGWRRRGIARALLREAVETAADDGVRALEAFPRADTDVADAALMLGPLALFVEAGFGVVHDFRPYPVLRKVIAARGPGPS
jgi:GNAT superfamily N-acetyltransferase